MTYPWQAGAWKTVQQMQTSDRLHHALLFTGEEGCGNEGFVLQLAESLLCNKPDNEGRACRECRSCQVFTGKAHPDFLFVGLQEERQAILIEQIRELNHFLGLSRSYSARKLAVIAPAERMNVNAANSLLKSLEEPAPGTHILLLTSHPASLLPTIRSRCQVIRLPLPENSQALEWLSQQQLQHPAETLLRSARNRPLTALELDSTDILMQRTQWLQHLVQVAKGSGNITEISAHWEKFDKVILFDWQFESLLEMAKKEENHEPFTAELQRYISQNALWVIHEKLLELKQLATHPLNPRLFIESMLMLWQARS